MRTLPPTVIGTSLVLASSIAAAAPPPDDDGLPRASYVVIASSGLERAPSAEACAPPTIFFLNKDGGTYQPGGNDASTNHSSIIDAPADVPAWAVGAAGWSEVVGCMTELFDRWNVTVTDVDPGAVPHYELVIAGRPQDIGMNPGVGGVSPFTFDCAVIPSSIVFIFAELFGDDHRRICEVAAQEIAHSIGLDHEVLCADPMTYLTGCGDKAFQDVDAPCGELDPRECACGGATQSSVALLDARLGTTDDCETLPDAGSGEPQDAGPDPDAGPSGAVDKVDGGGCSSGGGGEGLAALGMLGLLGALGRGIGRRRGRGGRRSRAR